MLAGVILVLFALSARMLLGARQQLQLAKAAQARGDEEGRVRCLRRAMAYYLPGNPWVRAAKEQLLRVALKAQARGDEAFALDTLWQLRSAILGLRGLTNPYGEALPQINQLIVELAPRRPHAATHLQGAAGRARLLERLGAPPRVHPLWSGIGLAGFLLWTVGAAVLLLWALRSDASIIAARFWPLLGLVDHGLALFGVGLAWA